MKCLSRNYSQLFVQGEKCWDISVSCGEGAGRSVFRCHKIMVRPFLLQNCGLSDYQDVEIVIIPHIGGELFRQYLNYVYGLQEGQASWEGPFTSSIEEIECLGYSAIKVKLENVQDFNLESDESAEDEEINNTSCNLEGKSSYQCQECKKIYVSEGKLKRHFLKVHPEREYVSPRSRAKVNSLYEDRDKVEGSTYHFKRNLEAVQHEETHQCPICGCDFKGKDKLKAHMKSCHLLVSCSCGETFQSEYDYHEHKDAASLPGDHSVVWEKPVTIALRKPEKVARTWPCLLCSLVFKVQKRAKEHMMDVHRTELKEKGMLITKRGSVTMTTICCDYENCGRYFRDKADKEQHMSSFHRKERNHICHICSKTFMGRKNLRHHIDMKHNTKNEEIMCTDCGEVFQNNVKMKNHQRTAHKEKGKKYSCGFCDYKSYYKLQLKEHERTHTGEKPEICSWCGQGFRSKKTLINHERLHTGEKPYKCKYCDNSFVQRTSLNVHIQTHHKDQVGGNSAHNAKNYNFSRSSNSNNSRAPVLDNGNQL